MRLSTEGIGIISQQVKKGAASAFEVEGLHLMQASIYSAMGRLREAESALARCEVAAGRRFGDNAKAARKRQARAAADPDDPYIAPCCFYERACIAIHRRSWAVAKTELKQSQRECDERQNFSFADGLGFRIKSAVAHINERKPKGGQGRKGMTSKGELHPLGRRPPPPPPPQPPPPPMPPPRIPRPTVTHTPTPMLPASDPSVTGAAAKVAAKRVAITPPLSSSPSPLSSSSPSSQARADPKENGGSMRSRGKTRKGPGWLRWWQSKDSSVGSGDCNADMTLLERAAEATAKAREAQITIAKAQREAWREAGNRK